MPYKNVYRCVSCNGRLSFNAVMYSHGRCPKCGHKGESACTVVDCNEEAEWVESSIPLPVKLTIGVAAVALAAAVAANIFD